MEPYILIDCVWEYNNNFAFVPEDEFNTNFVVHKDKCMLNESLFGGPYNSADTYMQEHIFAHARSCWYYGETLNFAIKKAYIWKNYDEQVFKNWFSQKREDAPEIPSAGFIPVRLPGDQDDRLMETVNIMDTPSDIWEAGNSGY